MCNKIWKSFVTVLETEVWKKSKDLGNLNGLDYFNGLFPPTLSPEGAAMNLTVIDS